MREKVTIEYIGPFDSNHDGIFMLQKAPPSGRYYSEVFIVDTLGGVALIEDNFGNRSLAETSNIFCFQKKIEPVPSEFWVCQSPGRRSGLMSSKEDAEKELAARGYDRIIHLREVGE